MSASTGDDPAANGGGKLRFGRLSSSAQATQIRDWLGAGNGRRAADERRFAVTARSCPGYQRAGAAGGPR